ALCALLLGALLLALRHAGALVLGGRAFLLGSRALLGRALTLALALAHMARAAACTALARAELWACEGRAGSPRVRRRSGPRCGCHAKISLPHGSSACLMLA